MYRQDSLAGFSLLAVILLALLASLSLPPLIYLAGLLAWFAAVRLFYRLPKLAKIQSGVMLVLGLGGLLIGEILGASPHWWLKALEGNLGLLTMLLAVSFLRLVGIAQQETTAPPKGKKALWQTLLAVHLFGSVINFSALILTADQLNKHRPLQPLQALTITRGFTLAAHWSPFFASMGLVLISAPGASLGILMPVGLVIAALGLAIASWLIHKNPQAITSQGISLNWRNLSLPLSLAVAVMLINWLRPDIPILTLVSLVSLVACCLLLFFREKSSSVSQLKQHVQFTLPSMASETLLFLSAGVLAAGLNSSLTALDFTLNISHFGATQAWLMVLVIALVSLVGVHPVISLAILGGLLAPLAEDPNLLAIGFLMGWALGVSLSPLSGSNLAMQGRYSIPAHKFTLWNFGYSGLLLLLYFVALHAYSYWVGN